MPDTPATVTVMPIVAALVYGSIFGAGLALCAVRFFESRAKRKLPAQEPETFEFERQQYPKSFIPILEAAAAAKDQERIWMSNEIRDQMIQRDLIGFSFTRKGRRVLAAVRALSTP